MHFYLHTLNIGPSQIRMEETVSTMMKVFSYIYLSNSRM